jgi:hypothetical protein
LRCSESAAEAIIGAGLPEREGTLDFYDLMNLALLSGSRRTAPELGLVALGHAFRAALAAPDASTTATIVARQACPEGCAGGCEWELPEMVGARWRALPATDDVHTWEIDVSMAVPPVEAIRSPTIVTAAAEVLRRYRFHWCSPEARARIDLSVERGVGDCYSLSLLLAEELRRVGVECELRHGLLIGLATVNLHTWVEAVDVDGVRRPLDPTMAIISEMFFPPATAEALRDRWMGSRSPRLVEFVDYERFRTGFSASGYGKGHYDQLFSVCHHEGGVAKFCNPAVMVRRSDRPATPESAGA